MLNEEESRVFTELRGTTGYMDPEFITTSMLTCASDIYSFGFVALQILSGQSFIEPDLVAGDQLTSKFLYLPAMDVAMGKCTLEDFEDPRLNGNINREDFEAVFQIAVQCTAKSSKHRPCVGLAVDEMEKAWKKHSCRKGSKEGDEFIRNSMIKIIRNQKKSNWIDRCGFPATIVVVEIWASNQQSILLGLLSTGPRDSGGDRSSQVLYLAQGRGGDNTLALGDLTSTLKVAMASSMEMAKARFHAERWTRFTSVKRGATVVVEIWASNQQSILLGLLGTGPWVLKGRPAQTDRNKGPGRGRSKPLRRGDQTKMTTADVVMGRVRGSRRDPRKDEYGRDLGYVGDIIGEIAIWRVSRNCWCRDGENLAMSSFHV
ncbi:hypothetical protein Acr_00g0010510 [Actinidia rufa]|uniref:Leucine-rich repeat protein kinase family protein n=1 Tax=Actinidia rufa TaxID=165716 RepID=A0A7J0D974_9ERIC|nr:hypothetical protein Acr_00g0010510 [Actinidia rufa]